MKDIERPQDISVYDVMKYNRVTGDCNTTNESANIVTKSSLSKITLQKFK